MDDKYLDIPFEIKENDITPEGTFKGYGSVFHNKDSHHDIVLPGAFIKSIQKGGRNGSGVAMLYQHDSRRPIGVWTSLVEDDRGLKVEGKLAMGVQDGREVHELMKMGALKGLSIGYDTVKEEWDDNKKCRYLKEVNLWEISPVTFAANIKAKVTSVKSLEDAKTEREFEQALRESGLSKSQAIYVATLCKKSLRESGNGIVVNDIACSILDSLVKINSDLSEFFLKNVETKSVIPFKSYALMDENTSWSAGEEVKKSTVDDLKIMCTWYDSAYPDLKNSYKLPHHINAGYKTVWRGVANAMARLLQPGTKIPDADRKGCYNHLSKHYKEFDKEVPSFKDYDYDEWKSLFPDRNNLSDILESLNEFII